MVKYRKCPLELLGSVPGGITNSQSRLAKQGARLSTVLVFVVILWSITCRVEGQSANSGRVIRESGRIDIESDTPRPMGATVFALGEEIGWTVDYEDPPHSAESPDVFDSTDPTWRTAHPDGKPFIGLRGGSFTTTLASTESASIATPLATIERIVSEYNKTLLPGRFSVRIGEEGRIAVVGVATRNHSEAYEQTPVLLDTSLELTSSKMTLYEALSMAAATLTKISGHQVEVGTVPTNLVLGTQCATPSGRLSSRVAIGKILDSAPVKLAYYLLHNLNQDLYVLNIGVVTRASTGTHGKEERTIVRQQK